MNSKYVIRVQLFHVLSFVKIDLYLSKHASPDIILIGDAKKEFAVAVGVVCSNEWLLISYAAEDSNHSLTIPHASALLAPSQFPR